MKKMTKQAKRLYLDIETRSSTDLKKSGVYVYSEDPDFEILMCAYAYDDNPVSIAIGEEEIKNISLLGNPEVEHVAHNANFERVCLSRLKPELGNPALWDDTMARASVYDLPRSLAEVAKAYKVAEKDSAGTRLINLFSVPNRKGGWNSAETHPEQWGDFVNYCIQDVEVLREIDLNLPPLPAKERELWGLDAKINDAGLSIDVELARACIEADKKGKGLASLKMFDAGVANPRSVQQIREALEGEGLPLDNLRAATVKEMLKRKDLTVNARTILEARQRISNSSTAKFPAMIAHTGSDGRFRGGFFFYGAHTGRWAGRGIQLQNLPRTAVEDPYATASAILAGKDATPDDLKALIRHCIMGPLTVQDFSAIEARVIAWLGGEEWALDAFREGRDIYVETGQRMGGLSRQQGKVAVLALGYAGGIGALRAMGFKDSDLEAQRLVDQWRKANPNITKFWYNLETAAGRALRGAKVKLGTLTLEMVGRSLYIYLPSGRPLVYNRFRAERGGMKYLDPRKGWTDTYGGRLAENITQAVARDLLAHALMELDAAGYKIIGHVHDEVLIDGAKDLDDIARIMTRPPVWAEGLPLDVGGFTADRYKKD